jgi:hypothetical protein
MTARQAIRHDDGRQDPDNPIVPFRMSDRLLMWKLQWWLAGLTTLLAVLAAMGLWGMLK